jgi:hypothetical protein
MSPRLGTAAAFVLLGLLWVAIVLFGAGCASGRRLDLAERSLAGWQQLHFEACLDSPPLLPADLCERDYLRLRALELGMERETTARLLWAAQAWRAVRPYAERLVEPVIGYLLRWVTGALSAGGETP